MGKSIKKNCGFTICGKSSKSGKTSYNAQNRAKTREILKEVEKTHNVELADSLPNGDNWTWDSDGKRFVSDTTLHQWFLRELNDKNLMQYYSFYWDCEDKSIIHNDLDKCMFEFAGSNIETEEELKTILNYNEKDILKKYKEFISKK